MPWYYQNGNDRIGPVDDAEFERLSQQNVIRPETLVWREDMPDWQPRRAINNLPVLTGGAPAVGSVACTNCGRLQPESDTFTLRGLIYCAECKPLVMQRITEGKPLPAGNAEELRKAHIKHEASVKSVGLLYYLGGVGLTVLGIVQITSVVSGKAHPAAIFLAVFFLVFAVAEFAAGAGIRRLRPWARIPAGIISGLGLLGFPLGTIINAYILSNIVLGVEIRLARQHQAEESERTALIIIQRTDADTEFSRLLQYSSRFQRPPVRQLALQKILATGPRFNALMIECLKTPMFEEGLTYLRDNDPPGDDAPLAEPARDAISRLAERLREEINTGRPVEADHIEARVDSILTVAAKFSKQGVDFLPAVRDCRAALDAPRQSKVPPSSLKKMDAWLSARAKQGAP